MPAPGGPFGPVCPMAPAGPVGPGGPTSDAAATTFIVKAETEENGVDTDAAAVKLWALASDTSSKAPAPTAPMLSGDPATDNDKGATDAD